MHDYLERPRNIEYRYPRGLFFIVNGLVSLLGLDIIYARLPLAFVFIVSGVIVWYIGKALNADAGKVLVDMETGQRYQMGFQHSLFLSLYITGARSA